MRIAPGKDNCLVLDYAGNIERHGCVDDPNITVPKENKEEGEAPVKICNNCEAYCHAAARVCPECGEEFPPSENSKIEQEHSKKAILSNQIEPEIAAVGSWELSPHNKPGKPTSLKVDYYATGNLPLRIVSEWVCLEHGGFARQKAQQWWSTHTGEFPVPESVDEAIERAHELSAPAQIEVVKEGKYFRIGRRYFGQQEAA